MLIWVGLNYYLKKRLIKFWNNVRYTEKVQRYYSEFLYTQLPLLLIYNHYTFVKSKKLSLGQNCPLQFLCDFTNFLH